MEPEKPKLDYESPTRDENSSTRVVLKGLLGAVVGFVLTIAGEMIFFKFHPGQRSRGELALSEELIFAGVAVGVICGVIWGNIRESSRRR